MIRWLYTYIFRGIGIVMIIGMITILLLAVLSQMREAPQGSGRPVRQADALPAHANR